MPNTPCDWNGQPFCGSEMPYSLVMIEKLEQCALSIALIQPIVVLFPDHFVRFRLRRTKREYETKS